MARPRYTVYNDQNYDHTGEDWANALGGIPLIGDIARTIGGNDAARREQAARLANQQKALDELSYGHGDLDNLMGATPSAEDMTTRYDAQSENEDYNDLRTSQASSAYADPRAMAAQTRALSELENIYASGGNDAMFQQGMSRALTQAGQQARGAREAYMQQARSRGMGGGGLEALGALSANQAAAQAANQNSINVSAAAQQRGLAALEGAGSLGGDIRGASFQEAYNRGQSQDAAIARYNAARQAAAARNADRRQQTARDYGTSRAQATRDRYGIQQGQYDRRQDVRGQIAGVYTGNAQQAQQRAAAQQSRADAASDRMYGVIANATEKAIGAATKPGGGNSSSGGAGGQRR